MINELISIPERSLTKEEYREWIEGLESEVRSTTEHYDRHECINHGYTLEEAMTPGIYIRELTMPAGSLIFSKIHLQEHPYLVTKGRVSVYDGNEIIEIKAPYKGITEKGTKRILYIHEDTTWITFHPVTNETIEDCDKNGVITCETYKEYDEIKLLGGGE